MTTAHCNVPLMAESLELAECEFGSESDPVGSDQVDLSRDSERCSKQY